jgi:hypothetical protein
MKRNGLCIFGVVLLMLGLAAPAMADGGAPSAPNVGAALPAPVTPQLAPGDLVSPQQVENAIKRAKDHLLAIQDPRQLWEDVPKPLSPPPVWVGDPKGGNWGGTTALATYALLSAGESPKDDAKIERALSFLKEANLAGTYAISFRANVYAQVNHIDPVRQGVNEDAHWLFNAKHTNGFYNYINDAITFPKGWERIDRSNSQIAVLGMWACAEILQEFPPRQYWLSVDSAWRGAQKQDGAWTYGGDPTNDPEKLSMTLAGVATLYITTDELNLNNGQCNGNAPDANIENALKYLGDHFEEWKGGPGSTAWPCYDLYGAERVAVAGGRKYIGTINWFQDGAKWLCDGQGGDGGWGGIPDTAWSLLFLVRGRAPVAINKLDYTPDAGAGDPAAAHWDERPRDCAKLVKYIQTQVEGNWLNWQIVTLKPPVQELHDAPILYIAGDKPLSFTPEQEQKIKTFIEEGGLVLFNSDCDSDAFTRSVKQLGARLFPVPGEFRDLPADHPIYSEQYNAAKWHKHPKVLGLTNGVRELMLLVSNGDPSRAWQLDAHASHPESFELGNNIYDYSVDRMVPASKGDTYLVTATQTATQSFKIARIQYNGNWNPEPGGWRRLSAVFQNQYQCSLDCQPVELGKGQLQAYGVAHLTGTDSFTLSAAAQDELKKWVEGGGKLIIDTAGANPRFADCVAKLLKSLWPDAASQLDTPLPASSPLYDGASYENNIWRSFARRNLKGDLNGPRIKGMTINGRLSVFFSGEDISGGLVGQNVDGILGYTPAAATELMEKMILYK